MNDRGRSNSRLQVLTDASPAIVVIVVVVVAVVIVFGVLAPRVRWE